MTAPPTEEMLDPRVVHLWRLQGLVRLVFFWLPVAATAGTFLATATHVAVGVIVGLGIVVLSGVMAVLWPQLEYDHFAYTVREHDLLVRHGVLFRQWSSIPHNRIQHVDTRQGPLERMLGLSRLQVFTAAGMTAEGSVPGLDQARADTLRDELSRRGGDDGV